MSAATLPMQVSRASLHVVDVTTIDPARLLALEGLLSREERDRASALRVPEDRVAFVAAHGLVRTTLGERASVDPAAIVFARGEQGKPFVAAPDRARAWAFNLSHARRFVACLVGPEELDLGVDVERVDPTWDVAPLARRFFAPAEVEELEGATGERQRRRFFALWTLKEAYVKARGAGLTYPLDAFAFTLDADDAPMRVIDRHAHLQEEERWQLGKATLFDHHIVAWAIRARDRDMRISLSHVGPHRDVRRGDEGRSASA